LIILISGALLVGFIIRMLSSSKTSKNDEK